MTAESIDESLEQTKGVAFIERLKASLPHVPRSGSTITTDVSAGATEEETMKSCQ